LVGDVLCNRKGVGESTIAGSIEGIVDRARLIGIKGGRLARQKVPRKVTIYR